MLILPLLGAIAIGIFFRGENARHAALVTALVTLAANTGYLAGFDTGGAFQWIVDLPWIPQAGIQFKLGYDGISLLLVSLTNLLVPIIILSSYDKPYRGSYYSLVLVMQMALQGVFTAMDGITFYVFWELALIPIYFICAIWGGERRIGVTLKFFIYTFAGSVLMLLSLLYLYGKTPNGSFDWAQLQAVQLSSAEAFWVSLGLFIAFAIKMPLFPFHTWQPDTYTESPVGGTMLLSGIMLKMGIYGVIRWMLPLTPEAGHLTPVYMALAVVGIVYASIIAMRLHDIKRIIAYSSIAHVGLIAAGVLTFQTVGIQGGLVQMLSHGVNVVGLFLAADIIEKRVSTRRLDELGGIARQAPVFATLFMIILLGTVAVPFTNGFVGELLLLKSLYSYQAWVAATAGLTIIFCAVYMFRIYQFAMFGEARQRTVAFTDIKGAELAAMVVLAVLVILIGVYPQPIFDLTAASVEQLIQLK